MFTPLAYNSNQEQVAKAYLQYFAQQYASLTNGINFSDFKTKLNNLSLEKRAEALKIFVNNPAYQKFQLAIRSLIATKSLAFSNLNMLVYERAPVKGLGAKAGMPDDPNLPKGDASPSPNRKLCG